MAYTEFLFDVCQQFGLRYYFAKKERHFVEEVTRVTWANRQEEKTGIRVSQEVSLAYTKVFFPPPV